MYTETLLQRRARLTSPTAVAPAVVSPVAVAAGTLAARFPTIHRFDARVANACHSRQEAALDCLAKATDKQGGQPQHVLAKAGANFASGLMAAQAYRLVGAKRDKWLGLTSPAPLFPPSAASDDHATRRLLHRLTGEHDLAPPKPPVQAQNVVLRAGHATVHASKLGLAVGASGVGVATALPTGLGAWVLAYVCCRLALHLQTDAENEELLSLLNTLARTFKLPISQRLWLLAHRAAD